MKTGSIILPPIPQADGIIKNRPAFILGEMPPYGDYLVCGISTQLRQLVQNFDELIGPDDLDFKTSGLLAKSLIRLGYLAVIPRKSVVGAIGSIDGERYARLIKNLTAYLLKGIQIT